MTPRRIGDPRIIDSYRLSERELMEVYYPFIKAIGKYAPFDKFRDCNNGTVCYAGREQLAISPDGEVYPCLDLRQSLGNLHKKSLFEIVESRKQKLSKYSMDEMTKCQACELRERCDSCIANNILENNDYTIPVAHRCHIARLYSM